jgi:hypothetical protein
MNAEMLSMEPVVIEKIREKNVRPLIRKTKTILPQTVLPENRRFGIVDLWKIRKAKRHFTYYR